MKDSICIMISLVYVLFLGAGCERDAAYRGKTPAAKMVVNSIIDAKTGVVKIDVSPTVFAFGTDNNNTAFLPETKLLLNDKEVALSKERKEDNLFVFSGYIGQVSYGEVLAVNVLCEGWPAVSGTAKIPSAPELVSTDGTWIISSLDSNKDKVSVNLRIRDKGGERNYYRIVVRSRITVEGGIPEKFIARRLLFGDDPVLNIVNQNILSEEDIPYIIFNDELIDGKEYTLRFFYEDENREKYKGNPFYVPSAYEARVELQAISEELYLYLLSLLQNRNSDNFSEPVKVYSNISGGYGILGVYIPHESDININK